MKKFCTSLKRHNFEKKKMLPLTKEELKSHQDAKTCYIWAKRILKNLSKSINNWKVRYHCHYTGKYKGAARSVCNSKINVPNEIPVVFNNGWNFDCHFIIKYLAKAFEEQFEYFGEDTEKYKTFSVSIEQKLTKIDKDDNECIVTASYKIKFFDSARFMVSSLSNLSDNLVEGIHEINSKDSDCFFEYESVKANLIRY